MTPANISKLAEYVEAAFIGLGLANQGALSRGFLVREDAIAVMRSLLPTNVPDEVLDVVFRRGVTSGIITVLSDELAGEFYSFDVQTIANASASAGADTVLRRYKQVGPQLLVRALENVAAAQQNADLPSASVADVPASDRMVSLGDNKERFAEIERALEEVDAALTSNNEVGDALGEERERLSSEIKAGQIVIRSRQVRLRVIVEVLLKPLSFIAEKFAGAAIGEAAKFLVHALTELIKAAL